MTHRKKHSPPTPEVEDLIDRLDDRYLTQKHAIYYFGALASVVITFIAWIVISYFALKQDLALAQQTLERNQTATEEFIKYHKDQLEILKSTTKNTDETVTSIKSDMDARQRRLGK